MINSDILNSSTGILNAKVEFYNGSTLVKTCTCSDYLQDFNVSRVGDNSKFFGYGVCQKLSVKLIDMWKDLTIVSGNTVEISYVIGEREMRPYPTFTITEVNVDEDTNDISVIAYDKVHDAEGHEISEVTLSTPTVRGYVEGIANFLGLPFVIIGVGGTETCFDTDYGSKGANLDGTEKIRIVLDAIAEATQTIYYINYENVLVFKRLDKAGDPVFTISRDSYSVLKTSENRRLSSICSATTLGDNVEPVEASLGISGTTQYIRDNPFWDIREDLGTLIENALAAIGGLTIGQIRDCDWTGNILLEIGDKLAFEKEDGSTVISYLLDDSIKYDGFVEEQTIWTFSETDNETESNPSTLDEVLNKTFARVDKVNKTINLVAGRVSNTESGISSLTLTTSGITTEVESLKNNSNAAFDNTNNELTKLRTDLNQTSSNLTLKIQEVDAKDITEVKTSTGFTFNDQGLTIEKSDSEMTTKVNEDGMIVSRSGSDVLIANNEGVVAEDLHATTWLIIGKYSRFTDYEDNGNRTACFWIGV